MGPLYDDFAEFRDHGESGRSFACPHGYRVNGIHRCYGNPSPTHEILMHARGIHRKRDYNYRRWVELVGDMSPRPGFIGTKDDQFVEDCFDERGLDLQSLTNLIAGACIVVGVSSGVMRLAAACGTDLVV